jgi:hypothetical protein
MRNIKNIIIIIIILIFSFTITGCDSQPILVETYDSTVTIEGIKDSQHVEYFTLMTNSSETIIEDNFLPENVNNETLTYEMTGLEDNTNISLVIDNEQIEGVVYEDSYQKTITQTNPDITIDLFQTTAMYQVSFSDPENNDGVLTAKVNNERIESGDLVPEGSDIKFLVNPDGEDNEYFEVTNWKINGEPVEPKVQKTSFLYENIQKNINVAVDLEKISYFKLYCDKENIDVTIEGNEIIADIQYEVENISDLDDVQNITCYVDDEIWNEEEIALNSGEKAVHYFTWNEILEKPDTFELKIETENETVIFYININNGVEISIDYELPPSTPKNVSASVVDNGIKVSWDKVEDAVSYNLVRKEPYGRDYWTLIKTGLTGDTARISSIDTSVVSTVKYQYAVVAVDENGLTSDYSEASNEITYQNSETDK